MPKIDFKPWITGPIYSEANDWLEYRCRRCGWGFHMLPLDDNGRRKILDEGKKQATSGSVKSYADAEAAQKKLTAALTAAARATPEVIGQFNKLAKEFQNTMVYSDDLVTEMQALLVQVGNVMPHQMEGDDLG